MTSYMEISREKISERPNYLKSSSAEPRSFGHIHRSFGRSFGRISCQKIRKNIAKIFSKIRTQEKYPFSNLMLNRFDDFMYYLISYYFNHVISLANLHHIGEKNTWNYRKTPIFCCFGGSVGFTEASAELIRPILTEASAEASVSVVH